MDGRFFNILMSHESFSRSTIVSEGVDSAGKQSVTLRTILIGLILDIYISVWISCNTRSLISHGRSSTLDFSQSQFPQCLRQLFDEYLDGSRKVFVPSVNEKYFS